MKTLGYITRALAAIALLVAAGLLVQARGSLEVVPQPAPLGALPTVLGAWHGVDVGIDPEVSEILGTGEFLSRVYRQPARPYIDLFIAYFPSQRAGDTIHVPKNCLPGSGWTPIESSRTRLPLAGTAPIDANRYVIAKGKERDLVLYWYQAHGRTVASEYWAKYYLVADSIRLRRSDGALVRLVTPMLPNENIEDAQARAMTLLEPMAPQLPRFLPD